MKFSFSVFIFGTATLLFPGANTFASQTAAPYLAIQSQPAPESRSELVTQARAIGLQTLSEAIGQNGSASLSLISEFESQIISAQEEWIQFQTASNSEISTKAVERFLALETLATWSQERRIAFYEFHQRLARMRPEKRTTHMIKAAVFLAHSKISDPSQSTVTPIELAEIESRLTVRWISFSEVPLEFSGLFVDGHWYERSRARFPLIFDPSSSGASKEVRLVAISNSHWPVTLSLAPVEKDLGLQSRLKADQALIASSAGCVASAPFSARLGRMVAIDKEECRESMVNGGLQEEPMKDSQTLGKKFGLEQIDSDPFRDRSPIRPVPKIKPWVWATLGGVALTALLIANQRSRQDSAALQPVHRTGW